VLLVLWTQVFGSFSATNCNRVCNAARLGHLFPVRTSQIIAHDRAQYSTGRAAAMDRLDHLNPVFSSPDQRLSGFLRTCPRQEIPVRD